MKAAYAAQKRMEAPHCENWFFHTTKKEKKRKEIRQTPKGKNAADREQRRARVLFVERF